MLKEITGPLGIIPAYAGRLSAEPRLDLPPGRSRPVRPAAPVAREPAAEVDPWLESVRTGMLTVDEAREALGRGEHISQALAQAREARRVAEWQRFRGKLGAEVDALIDKALNLGWHWENHTADVARAALVKPGVMEQEIEARVRAMFR